MYSEYMTRYASRSITARGQVEAGISGYDMMSLAVAAVLHKDPCQNKPVTICGNNTAASNPIS